MTEVFVALVEDTHADVEVQVFTDETEAVKWACEQVPDYCDPLDLCEEDAELNGGMIRDGWVFFLPYSDSSSVRVMRREIR